MDLKKLKVKLYADGAASKAIQQLTQVEHIAGFTTNPSLMRKDGVTDYETFARSLVEIVSPKSISFEVFADELSDMEAQARRIASWGKNVYVKIPVMNTKQEFTGDLISKLSQEGIQLNITALFTLEQVEQVMKALSNDTPAIVSVFAGRIADAGVDPEPIMTECSTLVHSKPKAELLWASTRELFNIFQANRTGCDIITVPYSILEKVSLFGKDLELYSLETVKTFYQDACAAHYTIDTEQEIV